MKNRRTFLIASGAASAALVLARHDEPSAALAAPAAKRPSDAARAVAATMRRFDRRLTAEELETIARGIDEATAAATPLRSRHDSLRNGEEPVTRFAVPSD